MPVPPYLYSEAQYQANFDEENGEFYVSGFLMFDKNNKLASFGKVRLNPDGFNIEQKFSLPHPYSENCLNCARHGQQFMYVGIGEEVNNGSVQFGDVCYLVKINGNSVEQRRVLFKKQSESRVGGGNVYWIDENRFLFWNNGQNTTTLYCFDLSSSENRPAFRFHNMGYFLDAKSNILRFQDMIYILSSKQNGTKNFIQYSLDILKT